MDLRSRTRKSEQRPCEDNDVKKSEDVLPASTDNSDTKSISESGDAVKDAVDTEDGKETTATAGTSGNQSPDPNCSICLGKLDNKSFTDSCFHMFCFTCLLEWSKVKAECPLCKQPFKSIIHNVRSYEDYDQYNVDDNIRPPPSGNMFMESMLENPRFRYRTTFSFERLMDAHYRDRQRQLWSLQLRPTSSVTRMQRSATRQALRVDFRRRVYLNHMKVLLGGRGQVRRSDRRIRTVTPAFFRANESAIHRLVPWLNRELNVLLDNNENHVKFLLELIMDLIKRFTIDSEDFYQHIHPFLGRRTRHFMTEFMEFAQSPYDMDDYDRHVAYDHPTGHGTVNSNSDDSCDSDIIIISPSQQNASTPPVMRPPRPRLRLWDAPVTATITTNDLQWSPLLNTSVDPLLNDVQTELERRADSNLIPSFSGWNTGTPAAFWSDSGTLHQQTINTMDLTGPNEKTNSAVQPTTSSKTQTVSDTDSDDEVIITKVEKPYDKRSPILLSSDSDTIDISEWNPPKKRKKNHQNNGSGCQSPERTPISPLRLYRRVSPRNKSPLYELKSPVHQLTAVTSSSYSLTDTTRNNNSDETSSRQRLEWMLRDFRSRDKSSATRRKKTSRHSSDRRKSHSRNKHGSDSSSKRYHRSHRSGSRLDTYSSNDLQQKYDATSSRRRHKHSSEREQSSTILTESKDEPRHSHKSRKKHKRNNRESDDSHRRRNRSGSRQRRQSHKHKKSHRRHKSRSGESRRSTCRDSGSLFSPGSVTSSVTTSVVNTSINVNSSSKTVINDDVPQFDVDRSKDILTVISDSEEGTSKATESCVSPSLKAYSDNDERHSAKYDLNDYINLLGSPEHSTPIASHSRTDYVDGSPKLPNFSSLISDVNGAESRIIDQENIIDLDAINGGIAVTGPSTSKDFEQIDHTEHKIDVRNYKKHPSGHKKSSTRHERVNSLDSNNGCKTHNLNNCEGSDLTYLESSHNNQEGESGMSLQLGNSSDTCDEESGNLGHSGIGGDNKNFRLNECGRTGEEGGIIEDGENSLDNHTSSWEDHGENSGEDHDGNSGEDHDGNSGEDHDGNSGEDHDGNSGEDHDGNSGEDHDGNSGEDHDGNSGEDHDGNSGRECEGNGEEDHDENSGEDRDTNGREDRDWNSGEEYEGGY